MSDLEIEKDESYAGVYLIDEFDGEKETAEFCGNYWILRSWEIYGEGASKDWFCRSMHSISAAVIRKLYGLDPANQPAIIVPPDNKNSQK